MLCMFKVFSLAAVVIVGSSWLDKKDCHIMEELGSYPEAGSPYSLLCI